MSDTAVDILNEAGQWEIARQDLVEILSIKFNSDFSTAFQSSLLCKNTIYVSSRSSTDIQAIRCTIALLPALDAIYKFIVNMAQDPAIDINLNRIHNHMEAFFDAIYTLHHAPTELSLEIHIRKLIAIKSIYVDDFLVRNYLQKLFDNFPQLSSVVKESTLFFHFFPQKIQLNAKLRR